MVERTVHTAIAGESHKMDVLTVLFRVRESGNDFLVLQDAAVGTSTVNLYQVLVYDASCTDIEVTYFRVTHLSVGQTDILAACLQLRVRISGQQAVPIGSRRIENHIIFTLIADTPAIKNH